MYEYENPVMRWVSRVILVLCILFAAFNIFTAIMGAQNQKAQAEQYVKDYKKIQKEIKGLEKKQSELVGETITAQDLGAAIAKDQNVLSTYAKKMYDENISGEELSAVRDLMKDLNLKLGRATLGGSSEERKDFFEVLWTKNAKAEVRFETVLKYYTDSIDCLFTIWDGENFYGYVTGTYDTQAGAIRDTSVVLTEYGQKNEPEYKIEVREQIDPNAIVIPEGATYTEKQIKELLAKKPEDRTEDDWKVLGQYWSDNNMEAEERPSEAADSDE